MSKIKHLIHKVTSGRGSKRDSLKSTTSVEVADTTGHRNVVGFVEENGGDHPPNGTNHHQHGRRRDRSLSLTDEKILRSEAREAADEKERQQRDAEKRKAYDMVRPQFHTSSSPSNEMTPRIL